jgi:hypothetical protein
MLGQILVDFGDDPALHIRVKGSVPCEVRSAAVSAGDQTQSKDQADFDAIILH